MPGKPALNITQSEMNVGIIYSIKTIIYCGSGLSG